MKLLAAIAVATLTTIGLIAPANAATAAGAGIEVNGRYIGGFTITRDGETREELVKQLTSEGWTPTGTRGAGWYSHRFRRQIT